MVDFTEAEQSYIDLFERMKRDIPLKDVSVFQQPITTREELLNTILARHPLNSKFSLASVYTFTPGQPGKGIEGYDYKGDTYPFWKMPNVKAFSDLLCTAIVNYMPLLKLPDVSSIVSKTTNGVTEFVRHYEMSIRLLLDGPPHANQHFINKRLAKEWVDSQKTPERRRLAQLLVDKTRYISHSVLLQRIQECVEKARARLIDGPVTFIVATKDKSNYYISLLFYHFWTKAGLRVDAVKSHMDGLVEGNLLDIDEMAYSGSQTVKTLASVFGKIVLSIQKQLNLLNASTKMYNTNLPIKYSEANDKKGNYGRATVPWNAEEGKAIKGLLAYQDPVKDKYITSYSKSKVFLPVPLVEMILAKNKINYIVIRIFCSENGQKALLKMPPEVSHSSSVKPPFDLIIGEVIPSPITLFGKEDALKLGFMFGSQEGYPAAPVYFNHKVADRPSTYLNPYAYGVIPDKLLLGDPLDYNGFFHLSSEEQAIYNSIQTPDSDTNTNTTTFLPFIEYCQKELRPMPTSRKNILYYEVPGQPQRMNTSYNLPQVFRCPYAWYKNINYDTGKYTPPVELRRGGTRRVKRRTTKRRMTHRK
jgi:hypothetical protein